MRRSSKPSASLLITTYNDTLRLEKTLAAYSRLKTKPLEIIVCDDGSGPETKALVEEFARQSSVPIKHIWQEDRGWDVATIRNHGAVSARGNYLIMTDGDCVPHCDFIADHLAEAEQGCFVYGSRAHVRENFIQEFSNHPLRIAWFILQNKVHNRKNAIRVPFHRADIFSVKDFSNIESLANTALASNFGVWKNDFMAVDGFDESFKCWWPEDSELSVRLLNWGLKIKKYRHKCIMYHLDHRQATRSGETGQGYRMTWEHLTGGVKLAKSGFSKRTSDAIRKSAEQKTDSFC
jgi:glycosyltransferase involved in cell wall biosynthesis